MPIMVSNELIEMCEEVNTSISAKEALENPEVREEFQKYLDSWLKAMEEYNKIMKTLDSSG